MKRAALVLGTILVALVLTTGGIWVGTAWAQGRGWAMPGGCGLMGGARPGAATSASGWAAPGMMGRGWAGRSWGQAGAGCLGTTPEVGNGPVTSLSQAEDLVEAYLEGLGYKGLQVTEVMEFERNYYAVVAEQDSSIGAMELLIDPSTGAVGPEPGPNMMWNAKYGMMAGRAMMGGFQLGGSATKEMTLSPEEAQDVARAWLDTNLPGRVVDEADPFYGYYTMHFLKDGQVDGMLSVHGATGQVWYHSWHGDFVAMTEGHDL